MNTVVFAISLSTDENYDTIEKYISIKELINNTKHEPWSIITEFRCINKRRIAQFGICRDRNCTCDGLITYWRDERFY